MQSLGFKDSFCAHSEGRNYNMQPSLFGFSVPLCFFPFLLFFTIFSDSILEALRMSQDSKFASNDTFIASRLVSDRQCHTLSPV